MNVSSDFIQTLTKKANESFFQSFDQEPSVYQDVFEVVDTEARYGGRTFGQGTSIIGDGEPHEIHEAQDHIFDDIKEAWTYYWSLRIFQRGTQLTQRMLDNWNATQAIDFVTERMNELGKTFIRARDRLAADVFNKGPLSAGAPTVFDGGIGNVQTDPNRGKIYDAQPMFSTAHPLKLAPATTFSNIDTTHAFSAANLKLALTQHEVTNAKGERNEEIENPADTILFNPSIGFDVATVLHSALLPGTANNDVNVLYSRLKALPWLKLTNNSSAAWFIGRAKYGLRFLHKGDPRLVAPTMDQYKGTGLIRLSMIDEYCVVATQWRNWTGYNCATS